MAMKKQLIAAGVATVIGVTGLGAGVAHAATSSEDSDGPMSSLVSAIATKFNLDKTQVQEVFDEQRETMEKEREEKVQTELKQLVTDGKLTQAQADAITAKRTELQAAREANKDSMKDLSSDERKAKMDEQKTALDTWAKEQGISTNYLRYVMGHGPGGHGGPGRGPDQAKSDSDS